jgi:pectinesterase
MYRIVYIGIFTALAAVTSLVSAKDCVISVSPEGKGGVRSVSEAIEKVPANNPSRCVIRIAPGTYKEQVRVPANKPYVSFVGQDAEKTVLTY